MKKTDIYVILLALLIIGLLIGGVLSVRNSRPQTVKTETVATPYRKTAPSLVPVPAYQSPDSLSNLLPTLAPEAFDGQARAAYTIAREIPKTLAQLPCYCHCDKSIKHKSLQSCFTDDHGANCGICMNEAMEAYRMEKQLKMTPAQIREKIIVDFGKN